MSLTIFDRKPLFTKSDGETIVDFTYPSIRYSYDPLIENAVIATDDMKMRPDLVSRAAYGTTEAWDILLKFNGISNPFSIDMDDLFFIPSMDDMNEQITSSGKQDVIADSVRRQYIDPSKKSKTDPKLAELEKKRREIQRNQGTGKKQSVSNLPPNISEVGDREITIKGGKVIFGPDISKNEKECETPLSKGQLITKLIKNR